MTRTRDLGTMYKFFKDFYDMFENQVHFNEWKENNDE